MPKKVTAKTVRKSGPAAKSVVRRKMTPPTREESAKDTTRDGTEESGVEKRIEGRKLIHLIKKTLIERNLPDRHIADIMGVTTIYWNSMANGHRKIKSLGKEKLERISEFLGIPMIQVGILAEYFDPKDFYVERTLDDELYLTVEKMRADPNWIALAPTAEEWDVLPTNTKVLISLLYEREIGTSILKKVEMELPGLIPGAQKKAE